ncbi:hypothetical protein B566_EDAN018457 [Ephemera danica]|nr:hypothetical protein B566_EDAN018457 [Ephemera danica]
MKDPISQRSIRITKLNAQEEWTHDPFAADKDESGNIYARGAQDMKCVGIQYLEAVRRLRRAGVAALRRTVHITFVPDEETGGVNGMNKFVKTREFQQLNVGFALDEGIASATDEYLVYYGERVLCSNVVVHCPGTPGHGSLLLPDTAGEKLRHVIDRFMDFRRSEQIKLEQDAKLTIGDVTTVNLTMVQGGVQGNVVPPELSATFDIRIATDVDLVQFKEMLAQWCREAGPGTSIEYRYEPKYIPNTKLDDSNPFWVAFKSECDQMNMNMEPRIFCGATDARFIREIGIPALGFSPMVRTPVLLHAHDEFLNERVFLDGIAIYERLITAVANVP